jgi:hypothetical protein
MSDLSVTRILQSAPATGLPGTWKLARGRAITLRPATDGIVRVAHGRIWVTLDGPHGGTPDDAGDQFLQAGRSMVVKAGQRVVMEAWNISGASYFAWDPLSAPATERARLNLSVLVQPLADLRLAAAIALRATGQLAGGLARIAWSLVRPRSASSARRDCGALS